LTSANEPHALARASGPERVGSIAG